MPEQHEISAFSEVLNSAEKPILVGGHHIRTLLGLIEMRLPRISNGVSRQGQKKGL